MAFHCSNQVTNPEYEDDVFYAELRRQILLLTADEDEEFLQKKQRRSINEQQRSSFSSALQPGSYFNWWESQNSNSNTVPTWLVNLWRKNGNGNGNGNGTGVFIPHIVNSRRHNKSGRMKNQRGTFRRVVN